VPSASNSIRAASSARRQRLIASALASFKRVWGIPVTTPTMMSAISAWLGFAALR
jgi:hypothetical protein